ncbi:MAG TPA: peptidylprolyl isomerase [Pyrinomonadaceae bacterium]|nr:peptidylprolyl isomerase [Pyrinomonadaceae bacterium]
MSNLTKGLILLLVVLGIGAGLVIWKNRVGDHSSVAFNKITKEEIEMLLSDVAKVNPMVLKRFAEDPEMKKQQLENMKQLLAFASQSQREGLTNEPNNRQELKNIRSEVIAVNYDREIHKDAGPMPPFGFITEEQINGFWGEGAQAPQGFWASLKNKIGLGAVNQEHEFQKFLDTKIALLKEGNPQMKDREISEEEKKQAREIFAKIGIYDQEYKDKVASGEITQDLQNKINLQVKLQQAQFLARIYSEKMADKMKVTDEDIAKYISEHPELDVAPKRAKAEEILARAKNGEDFAALANEFSEDPGNTDPSNKEKKGGLYADTPKGRMVPAFEQAALALEPGQVSPELVETDFGFHIIKLERKGETKDAKDAQGQPTETYDVRHILISTGYKDPTNPLGRDMPVKAYVKSKLEEEKEKKAVEDLVAANHVEVPEDFTVPEVSDEQIKEMMNKQLQQMPPEMSAAPGDESGPAGKQDAPKQDKGKVDTKKK